MPNKEPTKEFSHKIWNRQHLNKNKPKTTKRHTQKQQGKIPQNMTDISNLTKLKESGSTTTWVELLKCGYVGFYRENKW